MSCSRCQGFMVTETLFNPLEGSIHTWVPFTRCLNCGNLEDSLIRRARNVPDHFRRSTRPGPQRRGVWLEESEGPTIAGRRQIALERLSDSLPNRQDFQDAYAETTGKATGNES